MTKLKTNEPTKKQLRTLEAVADAFDESSSYVMLHNGKALAVLYGTDGEVRKYCIVERDGKRGRLYTPEGSSLSYAAHEAFE